MSDRMSNPQGPIKAAAAMPTTPREYVDALRAAYRFGWNDREAYMDLPHEFQAQREAWMAERLPLPKVTRPRVVADAAGIEFRVGTSDDALGSGYVMWRDQRASGCYWRPIAPNSPIGLTLTRAALIADLLANPTEEVDA